MSERSVQKIPRHRRTGGGAGTHEPKQFRAINLFQNMNELIGLSHLLHIVLRRAYDAVVRIFFQEIIQYLFCL